MNKMLPLQLLYLLAVRLKHFPSWPRCNWILPHLFPRAVSKAYQRTSSPHVGLKRAALILIKNVVFFTVPSKVVQILHIFYVLWNGETPQQGLRKVKVYGNMCIRGRMWVVLLMCFFPSWPLASLTFIYSEREESSDNESVFSGLLW